MTGERANEAGARAGAGLGLRLLLAALAAFGLLNLALCVAGRVGFPFPLEWMEGASLQHALRLLAGEPLYAAPRAEFVPYLYPPLAYLPMALCALVLGPSLAAARVASLGCTGLSLLAIGRAGARAGGGPIAGFVAAGMFAIGYGYTGAFLDLARVDACFVLLIALAAERLLAGAPATALACLALSAFAKQHGLLLLAAVGLALLWRAPRASAPAVLGAFGAVLLAGLSLNLASDGWFARYTLALPLGHGAEPRLLLGFLAVDLLVYLPVLTLASARALARRGRELTPFDALLLAAIAVSALGRAHTGGHDNVRLPAFALLAIAGSAELCRPLLSPGVAAGRGRWLLAGLLALQFGLLWQAPALYAPPASSAPRFAALRGALLQAAGGGRAVALDYAGLGSAPFAHTMALSDLRMGADAALAQAGTSALLDALRGPSAPAALAVGERFPALEAVLAQRYVLCAQLPAPSVATGHRPGALVDGALVQQVYLRADLYRQSPRAARCLIQPP